VEPQEIGRHLVLVTSPILGLGNPGLRDPADGSAWGMTNVFADVIVAAIIGNEAEHSTAILVAMKNRMDLAH
jgi:glutamate synthase domain-containing protein 2